MLDVRSMPFFLTLVCIAVFLPPYAYASDDKSADAMCNPFIQQCSCGKVPVNGKCQFKGESENMNGCSCESKTKPAGGICIAQNDCLGTWYKNQKGEKVPVEVPPEGANKPQGSSGTGNTGATPPPAPPQPPLNSTTANNYFNEYLNPPPLSGEKPDMSGQVANESILNIGDENNQGGKANSNPLVPPVNLTDAVGLQPGPTPPEAGANMRVVDTTHETTPVEGQPMQPNALEPVPEGKTLEELAKEAGTPVPLSPPETKPCESLWCQTAETVKGAVTAGSDWVKDTATKAWDALANEFNGGAEAKSPTSIGDPYLANQRVELMASLDPNNPAYNAALRDRVTAVLTAEYGQGGAGQQAVLESMVNRAIMRGYTSLDQAINDGFYGPVNSGLVDAMINRGLSDTNYARADASIAAVTGGGNLIDSRTDQGMKNEVNPNGRIEIGGEYFGYMNGNSKWSDQQRSLQAAYDAVYPGGGTAIASNDIPLPRSAPESIRPFIAGTDSGNLSFSNPYAEVPVYTPSFDSTQPLALDSRVSSFVPYAPFETVDFLGGTVGQVNYPRETQDLFTSSETDFLTGTVGPPNLTVGAQDLFTTSNTDFLAGTVGPENPPRGTADLFTSSETDFLAGTVGSDQSLSLEQAQQSDRITKEIRQEQAVWEAAQYNAQQQENQAGQNWVLNERLQQAELDATARQQAQTSVETTPVSEPLVGELTSPALEVSPDQEYWRAIAQSFSAEVTETPPLTPEEQSAQNARMFDEFSATPPLTPEEQAAQAEQNRIAASFGEEAAAVPPQTFAERIGALAQDGIDEFNRVMQTLGLKTPETPTEGLTMTDEGIQAILADAQRQAPDWSKLALSASEEMATVPKPEVATAEHNPPSSSGTRGLEATSPPEQPSQTLPEEQVPTPRPRPEILPPPPSLGRNYYELGDQAAGVRDLQRFLNTQSCQGCMVAASGAGSPGSETDVFGARTYRALVAFQKANSLPADGIYGPMTRALINRLTSQGI